MIIEVPDYQTRAEFPDDMPMEKVQRILQEQYPPIAPPPKSAWESDMRSAKAIGNTIVAAATGGVNSILSGFAKINKLMDYAGAKRYEELQAMGYGADTDAKAAAMARQQSMDVLQPRIDAAVKVLSDNEAHFRQIAKKHGMNVAEEILGNTIGGALPGAVEFMLGVPWAIAKGMAETHDQGKDNIIFGGLEEGLKRYILGKVFHGIGYMPKFVAIPATGAAFAGDAYYTTGDWTEAAKAFGSGILMGSVTPRRQMKFGAEKERSSLSMNPDAIDIDTAKFTARNEGAVRSNGSLELWEMTPKEFAENVKMREDGRLIDKVTLEEIPTSPFQEKQRSSMTHEQWIEEAREGVLRLAHDEGEIIPAHAMEGMKHLEELWRAAEGPEGLEGAAGFAGVSAKGAPTGRLMDARRFELEGWDKERIWKNTGWIKGKDGKWRFEIDDSKAKINEDTITSEYMNQLVEDYDKVYKIKEIIDHPDLFKHYPELEGIKVKFEPENGRYTGSFNAMTNTLKIAGLEEKGLSNLQIKRIVLHEIQHAIQAKEGFARGGNVEMVKDLPEYQQEIKASEQMEKKTGAWQDPAFKTYERLAGEAEAREVMNRSEWGAEARASVVPSWDGIPESELIALGMKGTEGAQGTAGKRGGEKKKKLTGAQILKQEAEKGRGEERVVQRTDAEIEEVFKRIQEAKELDIEKYDPENPRTVTEFKNMFTTGDAARIIDMVAQQDIVERMRSPEGPMTFDKVTERAQAEFEKQMGDNGFDVRGLELMAEQSEKASIFSQATLKYINNQAAPLLDALMRKWEATGSKIDMVNAYGQMAHVTQVIANLKKLIANSARTLGNLRIQNVADMDGLQFHDWEQVMGDPEAKVRFERVFDRIPENEMAKTLKKWRKIKDSGAKIGEIDDKVNMRGSAFWNTVVEMSNINLMALNVPTHASNLWGNVIIPFVNHMESYSEAAFARLFQGNEVNRVTIGEAKAEAVGYLHGLSNALWHKPKAGIKAVQEYFKGPDGKEQMTERTETVKGQSLGEVLKKWIDAPEAVENYIETTGIDAEHTRGAEAAGRQNGKPAHYISSEYLKNTGLGTIMQGLEDTSIGKTLWKTCDVVGALGRDASYGLLSIVDKPFKEIHFRANVARELYRAGLHQEFETHAELKAWTEKTAQQIDAYIEGKPWKAGDHQYKIVTDIARNAMKAAQEGTWSADLGKVGTAMQRVLNDYPITRFFAARFFTTPVNLLKYSATHSPLALLSKDVRADLRGENGARAQSKRFAQQMTGAMLLATAFVLAENDIITGSHPPDQREALLAAGIPEYSIKLGSKYYQYNRIDPFSLPVGIMADAINVFRYAKADRLDEIPAMMALALGNSLFSKTWLTQMGDLFAVATGKGVGQEKQAIRKLINDYETPLMPASGVFRYANSLTDPYVREAEDILEVLKRTYPVFSGGARPKLDWLGNPVQHHRNWAGIVSDTPVGKDPIYLEAARLGMHVQNIDDKINFHGAEIKLQPEEHWNLQRSTEDHFKVKDFLNNYVQEPGYQQLSDAAKEEMIKKVVQRFHNASKATFIAENEQAKNDIIKDALYRNQMMTAPPKPVSEDISQAFYPHGRKHRNR